MNEILPHVRIPAADDDRTLVIVDDLELFDYVETFLTQQCFLYPESVQAARRPGGEVITAVFPPGRRAALEDALRRLDPAEIEAVYRLNNPA